MSNAVAALWLALASTGAVSTPVVINEIYYNAPDDRERVQWIEFHNQASQPADIGGWTIDQGKILAIPPGITIPPQGFLVFALDEHEFMQAYEGVRPVGALKRPLKRGGEKLELRTAAGKVVDVVRYKDEAPWPSSADGSSASLERISPNAPGDVPENWSASPLPEFPQPVGTPGAQNASFSARLPPIIELAAPPASILPDQPLPVTATVKGAPVSRVALLYRTVTSAGPGEEKTLPMAPGEGNAWTASIPGQPASTLLRYRVRAASATGAARFAPAESDLRPTLSTYVHGPWPEAPIAQSRLILSNDDQEAPDARDGGRRRWFFGRGGQAEEPRATRGGSALVVHNSQTGQTELFDHIVATPRANRPGSGFILHFHKDQPYHGQTAASLQFEGIERSLLGESLSYDLYRRAGNAAPLTEFLRLTVIDEPRGLHMLVERPNKGFLRRNGIDTGGNLYKIIWYGQGLIGTHEKKTNAQSGHDDLVQIVQRLDETSADRDEQWKVIQAAFDVDQVANHFAVNMVLAHWDGYFNNYFAYHDTKRGKWVLFPWDHDGAWGGGGHDGDWPLAELPLSFGTEDAIPPGAAGPVRGRGRGFGFGGGGGPGWWRPGGVFSNPLLANPHFRPVFLAKVRKILNESFTEEVYFPAIDRLAASLKADRVLRQEAQWGDAEQAERELDADVEALKRFVTERRAFLLGQAELK